MELTHVKHRLYRIPTWYRIFYPNRWLLVLSQHRTNFSNPPASAKLKPVRKVKDVKKGRKDWSGLIGQAWLLEFLPSAWWCQDIMSFGSRIPLGLTKGLSIYTYLVLEFLLNCGVLLGLSGKYILDLFNLSSKSARIYKILSSFPPAFLTFMSDYSQCISD
jgi:hypothetical protein